MTNMSSAGIAPLTPFQQRAVVAHACARSDCPEFMREHMAAWLSTGVWPDISQPSQWFIDPVQGTFWAMLRSSLARVQFGGPGTKERDAITLQFAFNLLVFVYELDVGPVPYESINEEINVRAASWPSGLGDTITSFGHDSE